jgi:predicted XRE-type DNA-binding protein
MVLCSINGCEKAAWQRGWCTTHYKRWQRHGSTDPRGTSKGEAQAFLRAGAIAETDDCVLWPYAKAGNYGRVGKEDAHRAACRIAHGPPPSPDHEAAHSCGITLCINGNHLRWALHVDNEADKLLHGTRPRGEAHGAAKITEAIVRDIRKLLADGAMSQADIAKLFDVSAMTVSSIKLKKIWGWLE